MQQRYYDPVALRFLSPDPVDVSGTDGSNFNRYWYANDNPYTFTDPDGRNPVAGAAAGCAISGPACPAGAVVGAVIGVAMGVAAVLVYNEVASDGGDAAGSSEGRNTNPYDGPVEAPVIVVDGSGNAIPVGAGEQIGASESGEYQQVKDREGNPTGVRLDRGGHRGHADPKAQAPHGHRPGVTDDAGNPHLPVNPPKPPEPKPPEIR